ncbi:MAG: ABC transporter permease subunit [Methanomassiliicoccales archaeon]
MKGDLVRVIAIFGAILLSLPILLLLILGLGVYRSSEGFSLTLFRSMGLTITASLISSIIVFALFTPLSFMLSRRRNAFLESISDLPASIPHPIVGIALLVLGSNLTPAGALLNRIGLGLFDTFQGMVAALVFVSAPIYIRATQSLFEGMDRAPVEFASTLGLGNTSILYRILLPKKRREIVSAMLTAMSRGMSEFGSLAILAYLVLNGPFPGTEPSSVLVYQYYGYFGPQVAVTASAVLILFSLLITVLIKLISVHPDRALSDVH